MKPKQVIEEGHDYINGKSEQLLKITKKYSLQRYLWTSNLRSAVYITYVASDR